jgi:hypothetical protein
LIQTVDGHLSTKSELLEICPSINIEFEVEDIPPTLADETKACLAATSLHLTEYSSFAAGNHLLTFLRKVVNARVNKVNRKKFAIRAEAVWEGLSCSMKIRIFQQERGTMVEFQRRSGDTMAFIKLFRQAAGYLQGPSFYQTVLVGEAHDQAFNQKIQQLLAVPPAEAIAPLLDMADCGQDANLLGEVASALAFMAADPMVTAHLHMPCAFSVLQQLRHVDDVRIANLTSSLLPCM